MNVLACVRVGAVGAALLFSSVAHAEPWTFVALGDMPYGKTEEMPAKIASFKSLIGAINTARPKLVLHIGDLKSGSTSCGNETLDEQLALFGTFEAPMLYTPGDNEWTDCHRKNAGSFDPLERLAYLRTNFFKEAKTLGKAPVAIERQADLNPEFKTYVENARLDMGDVMVMTAHVVGSNNNLEARDVKAAIEFFDRDKANIAWLIDSFKKATASGKKAIILGIQADMFEFDYNMFDKTKEDFLRQSGFINFAEVLKKEALAFTKPVLLVFGDSHTYKTFKPFPNTAPNISALEVYGDKDMRAVAVTVDTSLTDMFSYQAIDIPTP
jgi:hypothetical protein